MSRADYIRDETGDLLVEGGDFVVGPSDQQHVEDLLAAQRGHFRQWPLVGLGLQDYINSDQPYSQELKLQLQQDGYKAKLTRNTKGEVELQYTPNG